MGLLSPLLRITVEPIEGGCLMRATGEIDMSSADSLRAQLSAARSDGVTTLLDLSGVRFIDASGLRVLLEAAEAAGKQEWAWFLVRPSLAVRRLLEVSGTASRLPVVLPDAAAERAGAAAGTAA